MFEITLIDNSIWLSNVIEARLSFISGNIRVTSELKSNYIKEGGSSRKYGKF